MLKKVNRFKQLLLIVALSVPWISQAEVKLNGFASVRATSASSDGGGEPFPGFSEGQVSLKPESLFALQASADLGENLSATIQLYADGQSDFDVEARWAYLSFGISENSRISAGRLANPLFRQSEYEKVGYAHNFGRLPKAVYLGFDFSTVEGVAIDSQFDLNGLTATSKLLYGNWRGESFFATTNQYLPLGFDNIWSLNTSLSGDWWSLSAGVMRTDIYAAQTDVGTVFVLASPGINAARLAGATDEQINQFKHAIQSDGKAGEYLFSAFNVDYSNWLLDLEYVDYGIQDSVNAQNQAWYLSIGRRIDQVVMTLHKQDYSREQGEYAFLNQVQQPILQNTGRVLKNAFSQREFDGVGVDLRWDFHPSAAFKADYFVGTDTRAVVGDYEILSVGIDLIF